MVTIGPSNWVITLIYDDEDFVDGDDDEKNGDDDSDHETEGGKTNDK